LVAIRGSDLNELPRANTENLGGPLRSIPAGQNSLAEVWAGEKRIGILDSFPKGDLAEICRKYSAYQPDSGVFSSKFSRGIEPQHPLPLEYFQRYWEG